MINVFGDNRLIGPRGEKGRDSFNLIRWAPDSVRRMYRESETVNFYFNTATDGVIFEDGKPVALKNRGKGGNAKLVENFPKIVQIEHRNFMIELDNSLLKINPILTGTISPSISIFALSFKTLCITEQPRFLFANENLTRAISLKERKTKDGYEGILTIHSSKAKKEIAYDRELWNVILIQFSCVNHVVDCRYIFNQEMGSLDSGYQDKKIDHSLYVGGHPDKLRAHDAIGSLEMYYASIDEDDTEYILSEEMGKCLLEDILDRVDQ